MNDFSKATLRKLSRNGIAIVGLQFIPGPFGGDTGYILDDNGTSRIETFRQVLARVG